MERAVAFGRARDCVGIVEFVDIVERDWCVCCDEAFVEQKRVVVGLAAAAVLVALGSAVAAVVREKDWERKAMRRRGRKLVRGFMMR